MKEKRKRGDKLTGQTKGGAPQSPFPCPCPSLMARNSSGLARGRDVFSAWPEGEVRW